MKQLFKPHIFNDIILQSYFAEFFQMNQNF